MPRPARNVRDRPSQRDCAWIDVASPVVRFPMQRGDVAMLASAADVAFDVAGAGVGIDRRRVWRFRCVEYPVVQLAKVTSAVLEHVERAGDAIKTFHTDGVNPQSVLAHPQFQAAALKVAREELAKAIALIERAKWRA